MSYYRTSVPVMDASEERDTQLYCVQVKGWFLTSLLGLASGLAIDAAWDGTPEEISLAIDDAEEQMEALMSSGCCNGVQSIRTNKAGYLESVNEDGDITILGDTYETSDVAKFPEEQPVDLPGDNICAGSRQLVERVLADALFSLDQAQFMVDGFKTGGEGLSLLLKTISLASASMGELYDAWEEWVLAAASLGISTLKIAYGDPAVKDKMTENIYCGVMDSPSRLLTEEIYFNALIDLPLLESQSEIMARFMRGFYIPASGDIFDTAKRWFNLGALNEDNTCEEEFECTPGWTLECDLTLSDGGLEVAPGVADGGVYVLGVGWEDTLQVTGGYAHRNITLRAEFPEAAYTGAGMTFTYTQGTMGLTGGADWVLQAGGTYYGYIINTAPPPESPWNATGAESEGTEAAYYIPVGVQEGGDDPGGTATITRVRLYGTGLPPEIAGWVLI